MKFRRRKSIEPGRRQPRGDAPVEERSTGQFRRNQTLSGRRPEPEVSERTKAHHLVQQRRKIGFVLLIVLGSCVLLFLLITQFTARVVVGSSTKALTSEIQPSAYEDAINSYFGLQPAERLRFLTNQQALTDYVVASLPEVEAISQTGVDNFVETRYSITFREPVAGWQINGRQYYVDDHGIVFEKNYYKSPEIQIVDESGVSPEQGSAVASTRLLSFVGRIVALAKEGGYQVTEAILPVGTTRQIDIRLKNVTPRVKFSIDRGAGEQVEDMIRSLKYLSSQGVNPSYVDVRVSGRAAYQ